MQAREADLQFIYVQIVEDLKSPILPRELVAENRAPSTKELSKFYQVNSTTAARAVTELSMAELVEKGKGLGMFVTLGARECIQTERREAFQHTYTELLKAEAGILDLMLNDVITMLREKKRTSTA